MASSTSALSSSTPVFNGSSTYSSDFQQVLTRAVQIASLPLQQMQNTVNDLTNQASALSSLGSSFATLQAAMDAVQTAAQGNMAATVSNPGAVSASAGSKALPGAYTIQADSLGSPTLTLSSAGLNTVSDPSSGNISSAATYTLTVNGTAYAIAPSGNSLESLANAINSSSAGVQATIVNVGSTSSPDYRLAIAASSLGPDTIQLTDGTNDLLDTLSTGSDAQYRVNGINTEISSSSTQVTLAPGLTVNLLAVTGQPVTITVANNTSSLQNALSNFANAYNSAVDAVAQERGQGAGPLSGQSIVFELQNALSSISQYVTGSGNIHSLADIGMDLDQTGHLSLDTTVFTGLSASDLQDFLGNTGSGGFLQSVNNTLNSITDGTTGSLATDIQSTQRQITNENTLISQEQQRINDLQTNLQQQLTQADAIIATLQEQKTYYQNLFTAEYLQNSPYGSGG
jgi:flagellar hook-associated protein 2